YAADAPVAAAELREHLAAALPDYMVPSVFVHLERLPMTANGKVDRPALPAPSMEDEAAARPGGAPRTETERVLVEMWAELLSVPRIGIHDEFFELGGHSLLAIRAVSRIRDLFDVEIPLETMFASPNVATLAEAVDAAKASRQARPVSRITRRSKTVVTQ